MKKILSIILSITMLLSMGTVALADGVDGPMQKAKIKVTTYKNSNEISARTKFLNDYDEYIFEDLLGQSLCGQELDGDTLWFNIHISGETVYIVSWEFPKNTSKDLQKELSNIAGTFALAE